MTEDVDRAHRVSGDYDIGRAGVDPGQDLGQELGVGPRRSQGSRPWMKPYPYQPSGSAAAS